MMSLGGPQRAAGWAVAALGAVAVGFGLFWSGPVQAEWEWVWVEGEKPYSSTVTRHPGWYDKVKRDLLSGGDFLSHWDDKRPGEALYRVKGPKAGEYDLWVRANPVQSRLSYKLNDGPWAPVDMARDQQGGVNIAEDGKPDLRFIAWTRAGSVTLNRGTNTVRFRFESANHHHGSLDCFLLTSEPFIPNGTARPDQLAEVTRRASGSEADWFAFAPPADPFLASSAINLRPLNEKQAGDGGFIGVKGSQFVHSKTGEPVRFWAVNGPPGKDRESLRRDAKVLAKRGVNLVRIHHGYYDAKGKPDPDAFRQAAEAVEALKAEGIYSHFSIYFPLWLEPAPGTPWLAGYDGSKKPFAALMFNKDFQKTYQGWWRSLLLTPSPATGKRLVDDPAVAGLEIQNEDSFFFWTFDAKSIPDAQLRILEARFGDWLKARYGSLDAALRRWGGAVVDRDRPVEGRVGFRPLWNIANEKAPRDQDTARFLAEAQRAFYKETYQFLRGLGFKGVITASNWATASPEVLGPIEKYTYTVTDFVDRHGYFGSARQGQDAGWSIRDGQTYVNRSALRFDPEAPGQSKSRVFVHPAMDVTYDDKPSMISETTWERPNRYRSEAPLYYAAYGALQGSDAVVHFAMDGTQWSVKPQFFMQPWTLMTPAMMGQFPAAALIFRKGLVAEGDLLADVSLRPQDLFDLKGTPLPQDAALDELRMKDVPQGLAALQPGKMIDPLVHYAGRTSVRFSDRPAAPVLKDLRPLIDRTRRTVTSSHGQLRLDYGKGVFTIDTPAAQGASGALGSVGTFVLKDLTLSSGLELGHVVAVSLDDQPLRSSKRILLQVMTEEKAAGFRTEPAEGGRLKILSIGHDPWLVRKAKGVVRFKRPDAARLKVTALDPNGDPIGALGSAAEIELAPTTLYYLIEPEPAAAAD